MDTEQVTTRKVDTLDGQVYDYLAQRLLRLNKKGAVVLFAGGDTAALPTTMPVNASLRLACEGIRCLLIDYDLGRNPLARSFELDVPMDRRVRPLRTSLEEIFVWPASYFAAGKSQLDVMAKLVDKSRRRYDTVIIYAPNLDTSPARKALCNLCDFGIAFSSNANQATRLAGVMNAADCKIIGSLKMAERAG